MSIPGFFLVSISICLASQTSTNRPHVQISNGTVVGHTKGGIDSFFGIPYTRPPVGDLRLRPPQTIDKSFRTLKLPKSGLEVPGCTQMTLTPLNLTATTDIPPDQQDAYYGTSTGFPYKFQEDCLTISVQRPSNSTEGKKLPVLFWIYGGGYEIGTAQVYDGSVIINQSISMDEPVIFVAINYRLNAFGFLQGRELQEAGATNLGLRDQRKGLEWVADNIEAFGGDPGRVTIWGESAGALSVFDHLTVNDGDHTYKGKPLFQGAIMNSGTVIFAQSAVSALAQGVFDDFSTYAGCPTTSYRNGSAVLDCLRRVSYADYTAAMNLLPNFATSRSNDLAYIQRPDPSSIFFSQYGEEAARNGRYAKVPVIMGNMQDEATVFVPSQKGLIHDKKTLVDYFASWFTEAPRKLIEGLVDTYSLDPVDGLPTGTGNRYQIYPLSKMNAAIQTDAIFGVARRIVLSYMASEVPTWSYLATFMEGTPWWGNYHTADLETQFFQDVNTFAGVKMDEAYIHFVNFQDPNGKIGSEQWWPQWSTTELKLANFSKSEVGLTKDTFRWMSYEFWRKHVSSLRI